MYDEKGQPETLAQTPPGTGNSDIPDSNSLATKTQVNGKETILEEIRHDLSSSTNKDQSPQPIFQNRKNKTKRDPLQERVENRKRWHEEHEKAIEEKTKLGFGGISEDDFVKRNLMENPPPGGLINLSAAKDLQEKLIKLKEDLSQIENDEKPVFKPYSFKDLLKFPEKEWLVEDMFGARDLGMIYGPPGCGKTFVEINFTLSMCTGQPLADRFKVTRPLVVWYCAGEGIGGLQARFAAAANSKGIQTIDNLSFYKNVPQFFDRESPEYVDRFIDEFKLRQRTNSEPNPDIVIIDTFNCATCGADENNARDIGIVLKNTRKLSDELSCAVFFTHHTNKTGTGERGSSALRGAMDIMMEIKPGTDIGISAGLACSKIKDAEKWETVHFHLEKSESTPSGYIEWFKPGAFVPEGAQQVDTAQILKTLTEEPGRRFTCLELANAIDKNSDYVRNKILKKLVDERKCNSEKQDQNNSSKKVMVYYAI